jgi:signal transduction histidine kinase
MGDFSVRLTTSDGISEHVAKSFNAFAEHLQSSSLETIKNGGSGEGKSEAGGAEGAPREASEDAFVGALSHEFRTPLNAILGWTQLLRSADLDSEKQVSALASIDRNAHTLALRLAEFLDATRLFVGQLAARKPDAPETPPPDRPATREGVDLP